MVSHEIIKLLKLRKEQHKKKPSFVRIESWRYKRLKTGWRSAKGIDSATRQKKKNGVKSPNVGYRAPKKVRSLHPSGLIPVKVTRLEDLDGLKRKVHGIIIDSHLGIKKRQKLVEAIQNKHFRILNMGIPYEERLKEK